MQNVPAAVEATLEVVAPDDSRHRVSVKESPFLIGRGEAGNHLPILDPRISRQCAAIVLEGDSYYLEDRGHRCGVFVNGEKVVRKLLKDRDIVSFGLGDSYKVVFHVSERDDETTSFRDLLTRMDSAAGGDTPSGGLSKLNLLLEATMLLHSQLPLDAVLEAMLDRAIAIINADRGLLLEADASGSLRRRLARGSRSVSLPADAFSPSQTAINLALKQKSGVVTEDLQLAEEMLQSAQSVIAQRLRAVVAIPLYAMPRAHSAELVIHAQRGQLLGFLYLDSRRPSAFSRLERQILDAIAIESASILDNARLVEHERERRRIEQELSIAKEIQQALLPRKFGNYAHLDVIGMNSPCLEVGGDYFDVFPIDDQRTAFLIADVSGKGLGAALLTPMLQGALSALTIGVEPERAFHYINGFLCDHSDVGRYATVFFCIVDREGNVQYLNAGHPPPLLLRGGEATELFTEGSLPLGLVPEAVHSVTQAKLEPGDTLVLFSDGVTEATDPDDELFGVSRLQALLSGQQDLPLDRLQETIVTSLERFSGGASQADDITLLLLRYRTDAQSAGSGLTPS
jgi:phosphoserine phosphatase RsbU/P